MIAEETKKPIRSKFQKHVEALVWKSYLQRQRRWRLLLLETLFAGALFLIAVLIAKPVFLTPLQVEPRPPLTSADILSSLQSKNILGYAPNVMPYSSVMQRVSDLLDCEIMSAPTQDDLNDLLYNRSTGSPMKSPVIWIVWGTSDDNIWKFSIRSTERARYETRIEQLTSQNSHLRSGFLAVQLAVSKAILERVSKTTPKYEISLCSMPVSPLMQEARVRNAITRILMCFTMGLLPPVLETEALVVSETVNRFKRSLRIRNVSFSSIYVAWLMYAYMTALPMCLLGSIALILIFRWIHLVYTLLLVLAYTSLMILLALIMAMFHNRPLIACIWTTLFTFLQTFLADLLVHHQVDHTHAALTFVLHIIIPPLGLVHGFNEFALLQTGKFVSIQGESHSTVYTLLSWIMMVLFYFGLLMVMQRTLKERSIGGQVSWKSVIFKEVEDLNRLRRIENPTGREREQLQEVDELVAKAISFRNVSKVIMGETVLDKITFDVYRGEFTMLYAERVQQRMLITIEDLLTGLTYPDKGSINILGETMEKSSQNLMSKLRMTGYCHRSNFLIEDLTVEEHITIFLGICLWHESSVYLSEYGHIRKKKLLSECDLEVVRHEYIRNIDLYYRAQLCWALALLLEPRVIFVPSFTDKPVYVSVIKDKIMQYKKHLTIVKLCFSSIKLEYADRVFLFDTKLLVFGGTPAYMFFIYGREYRVRITFSYGVSADEEIIEELLERASQAKATVRAHLGSLLILRLPANPTTNAAALIKDLSENSSKYGIISMNVSLPDSEEVCNRAIHQSRTIGHEMSATHEISRSALRRVADPVPWQRRTSLIGSIHLKNIAWKYVTFYIYYRFYLIVTVICAMIAGIVIGMSFSKLLSDMEKDRTAKILLHGQVMTVEALEQKTTLVLRLDNSSDALSVANAYVQSETGASADEVENMGYTALSRNESITEYLVTRAIDSPQHYVYMFAYGMDVSKYENGTLDIQALYSPMHHDDGAAARSLARVHMALIRHYTDSYDATIEVTDDPLALDMTPWLRHASSPPLMIQLLLILTISHITLLPSKEHGLVRHTQSYAMDFSPICYWITLYICDLVLYWILVAIMTMSMVLLMYLVAPSHFDYLDLAIVPFMLIVYGVGCVPQAYLFSLSQWTALNSMTFMIVNILFGETTVVANLLYGNALNYVIHFMSLSPQFNMAYSFIKIKQTFFYNSECVVFKKKNLCTSKTLHKCCDKCGVLQQCFSRKSFFSQDTGVLVEVNAILITALIYMILLLLWEYKVMQRLFTYIASNWIYTETFPAEDETFGVKQEKDDVHNKIADLQTGRSPTLNNFGKYLLAENVSYKQAGQYVIRNVSLGLGEGEALALSGLRHHGRLELCEILAGFQLPSDGEQYTMSKWKLQTQPYMYSRNFALSCDLNPLPQWMTVYDALEMLATLRGVPQTYLNGEVMKYIDALELHDRSNTFIGNLRTNEHRCVSFAAAVIAAPAVIILDECTAYQKYSVRRAMYYILYQLKRCGHSIFISSSSVESHMPVTNRLAILVDGHIFDIDQIDNLVARYSNKGYTVVVHLKNEVNIAKIFAKYFKNFTINDTNEVLVNIQVLDTNLNWATIFEKMETLQAENHVVYSYIVTAIPIDYIYNSIIIDEAGRKAVGRPKTKSLKYLLPHKPKIRPDEEKLATLLPFEKKYDITTLKELPWSVIFNR